METLTPVEARKVLTDAQASVVLALPPCDVEEKVITQDGVEVRQTIVRPAGSKVVLPGFIFVYGGFSAIFRLTSVSGVIWWRIADLPPSCKLYAVARDALPDRNQPDPAAASWVAANGDEIKVDWANPRILPPWPSFSRPTRPRGSPAKLSGSEVAPGSNERLEPPGCSLARPESRSRFHHTISVVTALIELADSRLNQERDERT